MLPMSFNRFSGECLQLNQQQTVVSVSQTKWQRIAALCCVLFGAALIVNVDSSGDGLWFWYGKLIRSGQHLYRDLHLAQQPLFPLLIAASQAVLGESWIASKGIALIQLLAYVFGLLLLGRQLAWKDWQRGVLITFAFLMTIACSYFRFDDYHITAYYFSVYAVLCLIALARRRLAWPWAALLTGVLSGLSVANRLNDGAALGAGCALALLFLLRTRRLPALALFLATMVATMRSVLFFTGDSVALWISNSIVQAAKIKGGTGHVLYAPLLFPFKIVPLLWHDWHIVANLFYLIAVVTLAVLRTRSGTEIEEPRQKKKWSRKDIGLAAFLLLTLPLFMRQARTGSPVSAFTTLACLATFALGCWILWRIAHAVFTGKHGRESGLEILLLLPFLQLLAGAMTSGQSILEVYPVIGLEVLLLPLCLPSLFRTKPIRTGATALGGLIVLAVLVVRIFDPYSFHLYQNKPLFTGRSWYRHPVYGPMCLQNDQEEFFQKICNQIGGDKASTELLSLPYPHANYFCHIAPWHAYVQTWYDTSGRQTIDRLMQDLDRPPQWILYQRSPNTVSAHEIAFNQGRPLPHRALDELIMGKIAERRWKVVFRERFEGADWFLLQTGP